MLTISKIKTAAFTAVIAAGLAASSIAGAQMAEREGGARSGGGFPGVEGPRAGGGGGVITPRRTVSPARVFLGKWVVVDSKGKKFGLMFARDGRFLLVSASGGPKVVGRWRIQGNVLTLQPRNVCDDRGCVARQGRLVQVRFRILNANTIRTTEGTMRRLA